MYVARLVLVFALLFSISAACVDGGSKTLAETASNSPAPSPAPTTVGDTASILSAHTAGSPGVGIILATGDKSGVSIMQAGSSGNDRPLDEHTLFEIGSITKAFTATILASMVLDHTVKLDDPVAKYLPRWVHVPSRNGKQITLLSLATQHSGLPRLPTNLDLSNTADPYATYTVQKMYQFLNSYTLPRDPGAEFEYSNYGVALLGVALANRAHTSYAHLLQKRVLDPLGMHETALSSTMTRALDARLAAGHDADGDPVSAWHLDAIAPAGGIRSSIADMTNFVGCAMGQGPLAKDCLFAEQTRATIPNGRIGLIWLRSDQQNVIFHNGATGGFTSCLAVAPDHSKGVIVLSNGGSNIDDIAFHAIDSRNTVPTVAPVAQLDAATLDEYAGTYNASEEHLTFTIAHTGDKLTAQLSGQAKARIYPFTKDHFYYRIAPATIDFLRDANKKVDALVIHQNGQSLVFVRAGMSPPSIAPSATPSSILLDPAVLKDYVGTYSVNPNFQFIVKLDGNNLMVQLTGQAFYQVYPSAKDHFFYKIVQAQIDFNRDATGKVSGLTLHQNGRDITANKVQ